MQNALPNDECKIIILITWHIFGRFYITYYMLLVSLTLTECVRACASYKCTIEMPVSEPDPLFANELYLLFQWHFSAFHCTHRMRIGSASKKQMKM